MPNGSRLTKQLCDAVADCKARGGRVIAVGTTSVRSLESAAKETGQLQPFSGDTRLFIRPGFEFKVVDAMITNFHLSESTLLMLVSAFSGYDNIMQAYRHAIKEKYRFFSYGDAMFLNRATFLKYINSQYSREVNRHPPCFYKFYSDSLSATKSASLSPRPDRLIRIFLSLGISAAIFHGMGNCMGTFQAQG